MGFSYDYKKAAEVVQYVLEKSNGRQGLLKLIKLLYIAERESLRQRGFALTGDEAWAMQNGPVLTRIYNNLRDNPDSPFLTGEEDFWLAHFKREGNTIFLVEPVGNGSLSEADESILDQVFSKFGHLTAAQLVTLTHQFKEWQDNELGKSSARIPFEDILRAVGFEEDRISHLKEMREEDIFMQRKLAAG